MQFSSKKTSIVSNRKIEDTITSSAAGMKPLKFGKFDLNDFRPESTTERPDSIGVKQLLVEPSKRLTQTVRSTSQ